MESTEIIKNAGLKITPQRKEVYDGDDAGRKNAKDLSKFLKDNGRLVEILKMPDKKDINDFANLTQEEFDNKILEWRGRK